MQNNIRYNILFLTKWYPDKFDPQLGIFIRKHAKAVSEYCNVSVVYVCADASIDTTYETTISKAQGFTEIIVYFKKNRSPLSFIINPFRYLTACRKGLKETGKIIGEIDLIHVNVLNRPGLIALLVKTIKGIPYIVTEHWTGYVSGTFEKSNFLKKWATRIIIKNASAVTTVSNGLKERMLAYGLSNDYSVIPNVVESSSLNSTGSQEPLQGKIKLLTIADLQDTHKNISGVLRAVSVVSKQYPNIEYHIIGDGPDRFKLNELSNSLGLTDKFVFFHGRHTNEYVYHFIQQIDFVVINSNYETFSVVAAEALANGKPVITTICGGPEEFMTSEHGILIEKNNQQQLEQAILKMISTFKEYSPEKLNRYITSKLNYQTIGKQFYAVYKPLIRKFKVGLSGKKMNIDPDWNVLDVGSGHRPNRRANVLIDNELNETEHRSGKKASVPAGKKMVVGDALHMPFSDKEFDFVIASHIAEHVDDPEQFCRELSRVGKRGYIETPGTFDEFFLNEPFHKWIVTSKGNCLIFKEKVKFKPFSSFLYKLYYLNENRTGHKPLYSDNLLLKIISRFIVRIWRYIPGAYTKYYWENTINVIVIHKKIRSAG